MPSFDSEFVAVAGVVIAGRISGISGTSSILADTDVAIATAWVGVSVPEVVVPSLRSIRRLLGDEIELMIMDYGFLMCMVQ